MVRLECGRWLGLLIRATALQQSRRVLSLVVVASVHAATTVCHRLHTARLRVVELTISIGVAIPKATAAEVVGSNFLIRSWRRRRASWGTAVHVSRRVLVELRVLVR